MRAAVLPLLAALLVTPAAAIESADVLKCFNFLPQDMGIGAEVDLAVDLHSDGTVTKVEVTRYTPDTEDGYRIARAAYRAVMSCAPYESAGASSSTITLKIDERPALEGIPLPGTQ
jgi:predicted deacylase